MLRFIFKSRTALSFLKNESTFIQPKYFIFGRFKKVNETEVQVREEKKVDATNPKEEETTKPPQEDEFDDTFESKEKYLQKLRKKREKDEAEQERLKKEIEFHELREKRDFQINVSQVDYSKIIQENMTLRVNDQFKHLEELYYFISNLRVRVNEENLQKCLDGFLALAERINSKDLEKPQYAEFLDILTANLMLLSKDETLMSLLEFSDLYIVEKDDLWKKLERKLLQRFQQFTPEQLIKSVVHFSNQNEGSDHFFDQFERVITPKLDDLNITQLVTVAQSFFQVRRGTEPFFKEIDGRIKKKLHESNERDLVKLSMVYSALNIDKGSVFLKLEELIIKKLDGFSAGDLCLIAESFGFDNGSDKFLTILETKVIKKMEDVQPEDLILILRGFIFTYRGSKAMYKYCREKINAYLSKISTSTLALIVKAYHITENEDKQFDAIVERMIINNIKNLEKITVDEIFDVAATYNITRSGSRELYKILEFVIREKMPEISKNVNIVRSLHDLYSTSGLCTPELIRRLHFIG